MDEPPRGDDAEEMPERPRSQAEIDAAFRMAEIARKRLARGVQPDPGFLHSQQTSGKPEPERPASADELRAIASNQRMQERIDRWAETHLGQPTSRLERLEARLRNIKHKAVWSIVTGLVVAAIGVAGALFDRVYLKIIFTVLVTPAAALLVWIAWDSAWVKFWKWAASFASLGAAVALLVITWVPAARSTSSNHPSSFATPTHALRVVSRSLDIVENDGGKLQLQVGIKFANDVDDGEVTTFSASRLIPFTTNNKRQYEVAQAVLSAAAGGEGRLGPNKMEQDTQQQFVIFGPVLSNAEATAFRAHHKTFIFGGQLMLQNATGLHTEPFCYISTGKPFVHLCPEHP